MVEHASVDHAQVEHRSQGTRTDLLRDNVTKLRGDGSTWLRCNQVKPRDEDQLPYDVRKSSARGFVDGRLDGEIGIEGGKAGPGRGKKTGSNATGFMSNAHHFVPMVGER